MIKAIKQDYVDFNLINFTTSQFFPMKNVGDLSTSHACLFNSSFFLYHPFQYFFQLINNPNKIQYPPKHKNQSTSLKKIPSISTIK